MRRDKTGVVKLQTFKTCYFGLFAIELFCFILTASCCNQKKSERRRRRRKKRKKRKTRMRTMKRVKDARSFCSEQTYRSSGEHKRNRRNKVSRQQGRQAKPFVCVCWIACSECVCGPTVATRDEADDADECDEEGARFGRMASRGEGRWRSATGSNQIKVTTDARHANVVKCPKESKQKERREEDEGGRYRDMHTNVCVRDCSSDGQFKLVGRH
jgi:hypothetical protein